MLSSNEDYYTDESAQGKNFFKNFSDPVIGDVLKRLVIQERPQRLLGDGGKGIIFRNLSATICPSHCSTPLATSPALHLVALWRRCAAPDPRGTLMKNTQLLLINDMCGYGKVALSAMLPVLSHMGYRIHNLPTALVSDTLNYPKFYIHDTTEYVRQSLAIWEELGFEFDAISTGFIVTEEETRIISDFCHRRAQKGTKVFVDPIMGDNGKLYAGYSNYTLRIRYDAKLNSDESLVYGDNGNKNEVVLTWKRTNDTYYDTLIDDAHIYTYATNITKTFSDGKEEQTMFDNVLFKAQNASDGYYVIAQLNEDEGIWYVTGHTDKEASATAMHPVEWNGKKGQIILKGVEDDQYIWTELETANGYTLLKNNIDVTITSVDDANRPCDIYSKDTLGVIQNDPRYNFPNNEDYKLANIPQKQLAHNYQTASATVDGNDVTMLDDEMDAGSKNAIAPLQVANTRGFETPMTGENGTWALAIGGVLVFCLGTSAFIFFLVFKKRKEQEDK